MRIPNSCFIKSRICPRVSVAFPSREREGSVTTMSANQNPALMPEIGPDGLAREAPVIAYTEKIIAEEQLQLRKYIQENYSKIRDVERELANLSLELKLTAGSKNAAFEHMRKKIELQNEKIHAARLKEAEARKVWEAASKVVQDEEAVKQKLCDDLNNLVQESNNSQHARLEELKRRLEALNPGRTSVSSHLEIKDSPHSSTSNGVPTAESALEAATGKQEISANTGASKGSIQHPGAEEKGKKKTTLNGRGKGLGILPKGRNPLTPGGWTGSGFNVDS